MPRRLSMARRTHALPSAADARQDLMCGAAAAGDAAQSDAAHIAAGPLARDVASVDGSSSDFSRRPPSRVQAQSGSFRVRNEATRSE